jgi:hypothetical protein
MKSVPVSPAALMRRINYRLDKDGLKLHKSKSARTIIEFGDYYLSSTSSPNIVDSFIDLEEFSREIGALKPHEALVED